MQGNLELIPLLIPYWLTSEIKRWNLGLTCTPHLWIITWETKRWNLGLTLHLPYLNKTRHTKHVISAGPKQDFLLYVTITHPSAIKVLQTTKITKLVFLSLPLPVVFKRWFIISELHSFVSFYNYSIQSGISQQLSLHTVVHMFYKRTGR